MSRRRPATESAFGSDSFLDIIANIVGILIILIVVAGVRVSQAPVLSLLNAEPEDAEENPSQPPEIPVIGPPESETAENPPVVPAPDPPAPSEPSPELLSRVRSLQDSLAAIESRIETHTAAAEDLGIEQKRAESDLAETASALTTADEALEQVRVAADSARRDLKQLRTEARKLRFELRKAEQQKPPTKQIRHKLTPVSHQVDGEELHFHLSRNRVAHVPLQELLDRLRAQVLRQKDWLVRFRTHQGSVGPVRGFTMTYVVQRQRMSVVEELRAGQGLMRIGVSQWRLKPAAALDAESIEEALRPGSAFHRALLTAESGTTLTFWVYPDSFEVFRQLKDVCHEEGFVVAARPLPFGVPIAGSPHGTRSAGQ